MHPEIQKKIDRIAELVRRRDAIDRELEAMLGVEPKPSAAIPTTAASTSAAPATMRKCGTCGEPGHTWRTCKKEKGDRKVFFEQMENDEEEADDVPAEPVVPRIKSGPKLNYDKEALEADIRAGHLSPSTVAGRHGVSIATVYSLKSIMKREGRLDRDVPKPMREKKVRYHSLAQMDRASSDIDPELKEQIKDLRDEEKTTTEIAAILGLDYDLVARVPARPKNTNVLGGRPKKTDDDEDFDEYEQEDALDEEDD